LLHLMCQIFLFVMLFLIRLQFYLDGLKYLRLRGYPQTYERKIFVKSIDLIYLNLFVQV